MKRRELLDRMAKIARSYGVDFDKSSAVQRGNHDKYFVEAQSVEVPRHSEIVEFTSRGILRNFDKCALKPERRTTPDHGHDFHGDGASQSGLVGP